jgi:3-hydroxyisobutyrate dehydrogenase-like beta-hydroxyacid dehydrogenase
VTDPTTGFIGLGNMGAPMAGHLLEAGVPLVVHDVRAEAAAPLVARGARRAASAAAVAQMASTVITIVPSSREVRALVEAMLPSLRPGHLLIEMTTSDPSVTRELAARVAERGASLVDAPVSGGVKGAVEKTLAIMIGGEPADVARARPLLSLLGRHLFHVGGVSTGHAMKLVNNMTSAACLMATAEAVAVAMRAGIDAARAVDVIAASSGRSNASDLKFPRFILTGRFDSGFALALMRKDVDGFLRLADELGVDAPVAVAAAEYFRRAMGTPLASADHTEVVTLLGEGFAPAKENQA